MREQPWYVSGIRVKFDGQPFLQVCGPSGKGWAYIPYSDRTPQDHIDAHKDAKLVAASGTLLELLTDLVDAVKQGHEAHNIRGDAYHEALGFLEDQCLI